MNVIPFPSAIFSVEGRRDDDTTVDQQALVAAAAGAEAHGSALEGSEGSTPAAAAARGSGSSSDGDDEPDAAPASTGFKLNFGVVHLVGRYLAQVQLEPSRDRRRLRFVVAIAAAAVQSVDATATTAPAGQPEHRTHTAQRRTKCLTGEQETGDPGPAAHPSPWPKILWVGGSSDQA